MQYAPSQPTFPLLRQPLLSAAVPPMIRHTVQPWFIAKLLGRLLLFFITISSVASAQQCPTVTGVLATGNSTVCSGQKQTVAVQVSPAAGGTFSGRFTNGRIFFNLVPVSGSISPEYAFVNTGTAIVSETFELAELNFTADENGTTCPATAADISGSAVISIQPIADLDAALTTPATICSRSNVSITLTNPNGVGGTYNRQTAYNGAVHTASGTATDQPYGTFTDVLTNTTSLAIMVQYIFTPVTAGCTGVPDTVYVVVNPKPAITCLGNKTRNTDAGACTAIVSGIDPVSYTTTACNGSVPVLSYRLAGATTGTGTGSASGKTFNKGITTVTYYITDGGENTDSCRFTVTVADAQPPVFSTCPTNISVVADPTLCGAVVAYSATATDDCGGTVTLTPSIASGSLFPIGTTPVTITAKDSAGNTAQCTFSVMVMASTFYVNDTSRTGDVYTAIAGNDLTGNGTQCAPFATIQKALTAAPAGSTVLVDAGTYREDLVLNKPVTLKGANFGVSPTGSGPFARPSTVQPATSNPVNGSSIVYLEPAAGGSIIDGFTFDGNNTTLTSGVVINGVDVDAAEAIGAYAGIANTTIRNNVLRNLNYAGIDFDNFYTNSVATSGNLITANRFANISPAQYGAGIAIANNCYTSITNNSMDTVRLGIQASKFFQADPGNSRSISGNTITSSRTGIWYYFTYASGSAFGITDNTLNTYAGAANNNGILIDSVLGATGVTVTGNTVNGAYAGINLYNNPTTSTVTLGANTLSGCSYGIFANNYDGFNASATAASTYLVKGAIIKDAGIAGIYVKDNGVSSHAAVAVRVSDSTVISNAPTGLKLEGSTASIVFTGNKPALLKGQGLYISQVSNGSTLPAATIDATGVLFDSTTGGAATQAQNFAIEDKIRHKIDSASMGFVLVKAGNAFVTPNSHIAANTTASVQRVMDAVAAGFVVNVDSGSYKEDIVINKKLTLLGSGYGKTTLNGSKGGNSSTVQVAASGVLLDGLNITREGNNPTDWNDATLNRNGILIQGQAADAEIRNCRVQGNYNGINISNSNSNNLHDNLVENNWNGLLFSHQTDSTLAQQNIVRNNFSYGFLFADSSNGNSSVPQTAAKSNFNRNSIYGNWYGGVVDQQTGILLAEGSNPKDFGCNWYGLPSEPTLQTKPLTQPAYNSQIPVLFGGTATAPSNRSDAISGSAAPNIRYTSWLINGTDTATTLPGFQPMTNACKGLLRFTNLTADAQQCTTNGAVRLAFQGGKAPYNLAYTGAAVGSASGLRNVDTIANLAAGGYTVTITDADGYVGIDTIVVTYNPVTNTVSKTSFATLQAAINAATSGDTLQVCAGSYREELVVNKKLSLLGPNATTGGIGERVAEAILYPARVDYNATLGHASLLQIKADSVTVKGFTFNGDNPDSTNGLALNGATIEAAEGITATTARRQLTIENNLFRNFAGAGISLLPAADIAMATGNAILNNHFSNIDNPVGGAWGTGIRLGNNLYARIEANRMDSVGVGIRSAGYSLADTSSVGPAIASNRIASRVVGIWHTKATGAASAISIRRNTLQATTDATNNTGLLLSGITNSAGAMVQYDTVSNSRYGIRLLNNTTAELKITGGKWTACDTAVFAGNKDTATTSVASSYVVEGATITGGNVGLVVNDDKMAATGATIIVGIQGNTKITGMATGVQITGSRAAIAFNGAAPAAFTGQTKYLDLASNGTTVPAGAVDATAVQFDGLTGATATLAQHYAIEDKINHQIDSATLGFVLVKAKNNFVTLNSHLSPITTASVQRGVLAADTGFTVNIAPGTFTGNVVVDKRLALMGAGMETTKIQPATANGNTISIAADSVTVSDLHLEGTPNVVTGLSATRGVYFNSSLRKATLTNLKSNLHQYGVLIDNGANVAGLAISAASFSNGGGGLSVSVSGKLTGLNISNTDFTGNQYGLTSNADTTAGSSNLNGLSGVAITNCSFTGNTVKGVYFEKLSTATLSNNVFIDNGTVATGAGLEVNLKNGVYNGIIISGNKLTNNGYAPGNGSAIALKARNDGLYAASPAVLSQVQVANNEITTAPVGISVGYNVDRAALRIDSNKIVATNGVVSYNAAVGSVTQIHGNSIMSTQFALVNGDIDAGSGTVNATCNWLNSTDPAVVAGKISGPATYAPYLPSSTDNQLATMGFQPATACSACTTLTATKDKTNSVCNGGTNGTITATASGGVAPYLYTISPVPATMIQPATGRFTGLPTGVYTVTGYGADGCSTLFQADTISQPTVAISYNSPLYCTTISSAMPTLSGTESYQGGVYNSSTGLIMNRSTGEVNPSASTPGNYTVTYSTQPAFGCGLMSASANITIRATPNAGTLSGNPTVCVGSSTSIISNGTSGGIFTSSNTAVATVDTLNGMVKGVGAGTAIITYTVKGGGGCGDGTATYSIAINAAAQGSISNAVAATQSNTTASPVTFTGSGGAAPYTFTYNINGGATKTITTAATDNSVTISQSNAVVGTFTYNLLSTTSAAGCSSTSVTPANAAVTITDAPPIDLSVAIPRPLNAIFGTSEQKEGYVQINNTSANPTTGQVVFRIPKLANFTLAVPANMTTAAGVAVNNSDWTITEGAISYRITSTKPTALNANSIVRIGFTLTATGPVNTGGSTTVVILDNTGGISTAAGDSNSTNNQSVKAFTINP